MSTQTVPSEIASIIEQKRLALLEEQRQKEAEDIRAREEAELQGNIKFNEYLAEVILKVPEWIRPYLDLTIDGPDYLRIAKGWDRLETIDLHFSIPGLAPIEFAPNINQWRCASALWNRNYEQSEPYLEFCNSSFWDSDLEFVLGEAQAQMNEYQESLKQYAVEQEERARRAERDLQDEADRQARDNLTAIRIELRHQEEKAEEQILLDMLKSDPVAIAMLKAYMMLQQERNSFTAQIEDANNSLYSMEDYWSRKAVELRRQADDAQRHAEDERLRLQSDLDDAEAKLVKEQRKSNGW